MFALFFKVDLARRIALFDPARFGSAEMSELDRYLVGRAAVVVASLLVRFEYHAGEEQTVAPRAAHDVGRRLDPGGVKRDGLAARLRELLQFRIALGRP